MTAIQTGANTMASLYIPSAGVINSAPSYNRGTINVIIDNMPALEILFYAAQNGGNPSWYNMAVSHALKTMQNNVRADGSTYQGVEYNSDGTVNSRFGWDGANVNSTWSRGQSWGLYGFTMTYRYTRDSRFLATAQSLADYFVSNLPPDYVPVWDFSKPWTDSRDSSAAAIAAAALLELSTYVTDPIKQAYYHNAALNIQSYLSNPSFYLADSTTTDGVLLHGTYSVPFNLDINTSLIWGDYYFVQGCYRGMALPVQLTGLTAGTISSHQVSLSWQAQSGAIRYNVKRSSVPGGPYTYIAPPPVLTTNSYTDTSVASGASYYYVVSASSVAGEGPNSAEIVVTAPAAPPDFSLSALPNSVSLSQAGTATSNVTISALGGFMGTVTLSASNAAGLGVSFNPAMVPVNGSGSSVLTVTAAGVAAGTYTLTITGTNGTLVHSASIKVTVTPGGSFTLSANPSSLILNKSTSPTAGSTISVASVNGFAGSVSLSISSVPRGVSATISPSSISVGGAGAALKLVIGRHASAGAYSISVSGKSNGVPQFTLTVPVQIKN
jgi:hypothetical protein